MKPGATGILPSRIRMVSVLTSYNILRRTNRPGKNNELQTLHWRRDNNTAPMHFYSLNILRNQHFQLTQVLSPNPKTWLPGILIKISFPLVTVLSSCRVSLVFKIVAFVFLNRSSKFSLSITARDLSIWV